MSVTLSSLTSEKQLGFLNRQAVAVSLSVVMVQQFWSIVIVVGMMVSVLARLACQPLERELGWVGVFVRISAQNLWGWVVS